MSLKEYHRKRDFEKTPEPEGKEASSETGRLYVIQKHAAQRLHYDFRLEMGGVLKSWAVPKGPSMDPGEKRLAVHVEDHPIEYGDFEGIIPEDEYGGGTVMLWDRGTWEPQGDPEKGYRQGKLKFTLSGEKLHGGWALVRMGGKSKDEDNWLLIKEKDDQADSDADVLKEQPNSVISDRSLEEIASSNPPVWKDGRAVRPEEGSSEGGSSPEDLGRLDPSGLPGARQAAQPAVLEPQMATLVEEIPGGDNWLHEIKLDGYRMICILEGGEARLLTRNANDWSEKFPRILLALTDLPCQRAILDGEIVILLADGTTDFQAMQNALSGGQDERLVYFLFDLPFFGGYDLRNVPLLERKQLLQTLLAAHTDKRLRYSDHIRGLGPKVYHHACRMSLEGTVSKQVSSPYESSRTRTWVKTKCLLRQEFVVGGFTEPSGSRQKFGALLLGTYDKRGDLIFHGKVGTGFDQETLRRVYAQIEPLEQAGPSFKNPPSRRLAKGVHWISPELVAEVEFASWTRDQLVRQASFQGLRDDKSPDQVHVEQPQKTPGETNHEREPSQPGERKGKVSQKDHQVAGVTLTHPDRVLFPEQGVTKRELAGYYQQVGDWILPYVVGRPLSLVRCPSGHDEQCFYQKNYSDSMPSQVKGVDVTESDGEKAIYVGVDDLAGIIALVQIGVLEMHPWGSRVDRLERPDIMVFDLDPAPEVPWEKVITAAYRVRERLNGLRLQSFVKTSGGKGLHVMVPLERRSDWEEMGDFSEALAKDIAATNPDEYIATASKAKRKGKVFIDYLRNRRGATNVAAYSTRARAGAPVSTPVRWDELGGLKSAQAYTINNVPRRLASLESDPWEGFFDLRQSITKDMKVELGLGV